MGKAPKPMALAAVMAGVLPIGLTHSLLYALLPLIARQANIDAATYGAFVAVGSFAMLLGALFAGRVTDRRGRRGPFVLALLVIALSLAAVATLFAIRRETGIADQHTLVGLFLSRIVFGLAAAMVLTAAQAALIDMSSVEGRAHALGYVSSATGVGLIAGSVAVSVLAGRDLLYPIWTFAAMAAAAAVAVRLGLPQTGDRHASPSPEIESTPARLAPVLALAFVPHFVLSVAQQTIAMRIADVMGWTAPDTVRVVGVFLVGAALSLALAQILVVPRVPLRILLPAAFAGLSASFLGLALAGDLAAFGLSTAILGLSMGIAAPAVAACVSLKAGKKEQGQAAGWLTATQIVGVTAGSLAGGGLYAVSPEAVYPSCLAITLTLAVLAFSLRANLSRSPQPDLQ